MPPREIIPLLRALQSTPSTIRVLAGVDGGFTLQVLVSSEKTLVSLDGVLAGIIILSRLMTAGSFVRILFVGSPGVDTVPQTLVAHSLDNQFAPRRLGKGEEVLRKEKRKRRKGDFLPDFTVFVLAIATTTTVLVGPGNMKDGAKG